MKPVLISRTIQAIKAAGMNAGVALNPHTPVAVLENVISDLDLVCIMSVNPAFGGQSFIENTYKKVSQLQHLIELSGANCRIEIDGGVTNKNADKLIKAGANVLVAGSYLFESKNPSKQFRTQKSNCIGLYSIIDVETTGNAYKGQKITELCVLLFDGKRVVDEFTSLVNPEQPIPNRITSLTGITNAMVQEAPKFYEIAKRVEEFTKDSIFVAHNVNFD